MTQEQKQKIEQAAAERFSSTISQNFFTIGARHVLQNPADFGLVSQNDVDAGILLRIDQVKAADALIAKYRSLLSELTTVLHRYSQVWGYDESNLVYKATEALKQEGE